jgi:hypothetical protein
VNWGLYFVCRVDSGSVGSGDLSWVIAQGLAVAEGWSALLPSQDDARFDKAVSVNAAIALRLLMRVMLSRLLIFRSFLETARSTGHELTERHKQLWLLLQVAPTLLSDNHRDIFHSLCRGPLRGARDEQVSELIQSTFEDIKNILQEQLPNGNLFCVLDEAQVAADSHNYAFISGDRTIHRPVLKEIVRVWSACLPGSESLRFVVAGTGLSVQVVNDAVESAVGKAGNFVKFHDTGAFNDRQSHESYIRRYFPVEFLKTDPGQQLLRRSWHWVHGR